MFRTAFRDFHSLTLNLTKRLVQVAIMQATSRLRSKRRRLRHGVKPMVRKRDVRAAIDILGLQRNGKHRWKGAARRCGVRVYDEQRLTRFKSKKWDLTYDEVEEILGPPKAPARTDTDASEPSGDEGRRKFKNRAARSGTPLPVGPLAISESGSDSDPAPDPDLDSNSDWDSDIVLETDLEDDQLDSDGASGSGFPSSYVKRDPAGRFASIPPSSAIEPDTTYTLEQFDQEASRLEEQALCRKLGLAPPPKDEPKSEDEPDINVDFAIIDHTDDWRAWTSYHAEWETFRKPVRAAKFAANQRPVAPAVPRPIDTENISSGTDSGSDLGASARRSKRRKTAGIELEAQNPHTYAALQGNIYKMDDMGSDGVDTEEDPRLGADVPAQSVEDAADAMDWK
jgi:RNA polymerase I-specific transcription initiation factor RRN5